jgi:hypothetical protein
VKKKILTIILVLAGFLRLYNLPNTLMFQGDQGRDALIVSEIFLEKNLVFIGPVTSVGNLYLGPLYYYFMLPFLALSYPSPLGPAYAVSLLSILTVYLVYKLGKELIGEKAALIASLLIAISSSAVFLARFSWNPNPAPLVSLVMIYFTYKAIKKPKNWIWVSLCFSVLIQLHYLALLSAGGAGIVWLTTLFQQIKNKISLKKLIIYSSISLVIFLISLTPLILFDLKHQGLNLSAFKNMFTNTRALKTSLNTNFFQKIILTAQETEGRFMHIMYEITIGKIRILNQVLTYSLLIALVFITKKAKKYKTGILVVLAYLFTGVVGTALYDHSVFNHYIAYLYPVTFLVLGLAISYSCKNILLKLLSFSFIVFFIYFNFNSMPLKTLGWNINDMKRTSDKILEKVKPGEKYNIVLLSESGDLYGQNYRYFLSSNRDKKPVKAEGGEEIETLFIINEDRAISNVSDSPIYEIVVFPNKNPAEIFEIEGGPEITVLRK